MNTYPDIMCHQIDMNKLVAKKEQEKDPVVCVNDLKMSFVDENGVLTALSGLTFSVMPQEFVCILGPSGCGKSVLLRVLSGLLQPSAGEVVYSPGKRKDDCPRIGIVFQQANLMPWRTIIDNITLPLEMQGINQQQSIAAAKEWMEVIGLQGFETAWPRDLSGGMAQRVALARALIQDPDLLLLDEPFGALDALTREQMGTELLNLWQNRRKTVIMVTHSISEALLLADRVLVLSPRPGKICLDIVNDIPRPRSEDMRYTQRFSELARILRSSIRLQ